MEGAQWKVSTKAGIVAAAREVNKIGDERSRTEGSVVGTVVVAMLRQEVWCDSEKMTVVRNGGGVNSDNR